MKTFVIQPDNLRFTNFRKTLKALIKIRHLTQKQLAKELDITEYKMSDYCNGRQDPESYDLIKLANYFEISIESLLGQDEYLNRFITQQKSLENVFEKIPLSTVEKLIENKEVIIFKDGKQSYHEVFGIDLISKRIILEERTLRFEDYGKTWTTN